MKKDIYQRAVSAYGVDAQLDQAQEECAELIVSINHFRRGRTNWLGVAGEVADVRIMMRQLRRIIGAGVVDKIERAKLQRLDKKIKDHLRENRDVREPGG